MPNFFRWAWAEELPPSSPKCGTSEDMSEGDRVAVGGAWVTATDGSAQAGEAAERRRENSTSSP